MLPFVLSLSKDFAVPFAPTHPFVLSLPVLSSVEGSQSFVVPVAHRRPFGLSLSKAFVAVGG